MTRRRPSGPHHPRRRAAAAGALLACLLAAAHAAGAPDLHVREVGFPTDRGSCTAPSVGGTVAVTLANEGPDTAPLPIDLVAYEDRDGDGTFDGGLADVVLGTLALAAPLSGGEVRSLDVPASGDLAFRDAPVHVVADSANLLSELDESNNVLHSGTACGDRAPAGDFAPEVEWEWTGVPVDSTPLVGDVDADGTPEVVFIAEDGIIRALDGANGALLWSTTAFDPLAGRWTAPALGDLDGDPGLEVVAVASTREHLLAFDDDGSLLWESVPRTRLGGGSLGGVSLADLDCDGVAEVIYGRDVFDARDGTLFWTPEDGGTFGSNSGFSGFSVALDVDGDGRLEVVAGPTAYELDPATGTGRIKWQTDGVPDGLPAVGNFDDDPGPEIVLTGSGMVSLLEGETGELVWSVPFPEGGGGCAGFSPRVGAPTVADFDGDGAAEIGASGADWYVVFEADGSVAWQHPIEDCSSHMTSSTVFDFEGDGVPEVVYQDEILLRILRGTDGAEIVALPASSLTWQEMVTIADVDGDGNAEIISPLNPHRGSTLQGVRVWGDGSDNWVSTRRIWNQHAYHVGHVSEDGRVAGGGGECEEDSWLTHGTYRRQLVGEGGFLPAADLTVSIVLDEVRASGACGRELELAARVGNGGGTSTGGPTELRIFEGDPALGAPLLRTEVVPELEPGEWIEVGLVLPVPPEGLPALHVLADDDGSGPASGIVRECRDDNNSCVSSAISPEDGLDLPAPVGPVLRATGHGDPGAALATADFEWSGDEGLPRPPGAHYHVVRASRPGALALVLDGHPHTGTTWRDESPRADAVPAVTYLRVLAADACENEEPTASR